MIFCVYFKIYQQIFARTAIFVHLFCLLKSNKTTNICWFRMSTMK